jgi:hypothetical protein
VHCTRESVEEALGLRPCAAKSISRLHTSLLDTHALARAHIRTCSQRNRRTYAYPHPHPHPHPRPRPHPHERAHAHARMHTDICAAPVIDETSVRLLSAQLESTAHSRTLSSHGPQPVHATGTGSEGDGEPVRLIARQTCGAMGRERRCYKQRFGVLWPETLSGAMNGGAPAPMVYPLVVPKVEPRGLPSAGRDEQSIRRPPAELADGPKPQREAAIANDARSCILRVRSYDL